MKKNLLVVVFGLFVAGLLKANVPNQLNAALPADAKNAIKISIDTDAENFKSQYAEDIADDAYLVYGTAPLPATSNVDGGYSFKSNRIGSWWNPWTDITISFDFWTNHFMPGMNGVGVLYENSWSFSKNTEVLDQNGYTATSLDETYLSQYGNGWVHREFTIPAVESNLVVDMWFTTALKVGDLKELPGRLDMYYTNLKVRYNNQEIDLFGSDNSVFTVEEINKTANYQKVEDSYTLKEWGVVEGLGWDGLYSMTGVPCRRATEARSISAINTLPQIAEITSTIPASLVAGIEYNVLGYAQSSEPIVVESLKLEGVELDITGANFNAYTFEESGQYTIVFKTSKDGNDARLKKTFSVASASTPVFDNDDIRLAVPATGYAHEPIKLGKVNAFVNGVKDFPATPVVRNSSDEPFQVTEVADGFTFQPVQKKADTYIVYYTATNEGYTTNSAERIVSVSDIDKPVIDFSGLTPFDVGTIYNVSDIKDSIAVTDRSDGTLNVQSISIIDPLGKEMVNENGKFMAKYSGKYTINARSEADAEGNITELSVQIGTNQSEGLVLTQIVEVPEEYRAEGITKSGRSQVWHTDYTLSLGDRIVYDVMAYTQFDDGTYGFIPGVGGLGGQINGTWEMIDTLFDSTESLDVAGDSMARTTDLSSKLHDDNGKPVWYTREYKVKAGDAVIYGNQFWHFATTFETNAAVGSKIVTMIRNAVIYDAEGEVKGTLWNGTQPVQDEWKTENSNVGKVYIGATVDVTPIPISGKIPNIAGFGATVSFPKGLMKDPQTDTVLDATVIVKDPTGQEVTLSETTASYSFVATVLGKYKVVVSATNGEFTTTNEYEIVVSDLIKPEISINTNEDSYVVGDTIVTTVIISDNHTQFSSLKDAGVSVSKDGEVIEATITTTDNGFTISFEALEKGSYIITTYATDASNNETVETLTIEVGTAPKGNLPLIIGLSVGAVGLVAAVGVSFLLLRKRKIVK